MADQDRLVLRRRGYKQFQGIGFWFLTGLMAIPFLSLTGTLWLPIDNELVEKFADEMRKKDAFLTATQFLLPLLMMLTMRFTMRATLILDDAGIIFLSGIPEKYQWIRLDWRYQWNEISGIVHKKQKMVNPRLSRIALYTNKKTVHIVPWQWVDPNDPANKQSLKSQFTFSTEKLYQQVEETPVMRFLKERGLLEYQKNFIDPDDTLNSNRKARIIAILFVLFIFYFIGDVYFGLTEYYIPTTPWHVFILLGGVGVYTGYLFLRNEGLRKQETLAMALLFGLGVGLISYPLSIHAAQWAEPSGLASYIYELREDGDWYSLQNDMPALHFDRRSDYWAQFAVGEQKAFELRQGILGYLQINMTQIYADQKEFYEKKHDNDNPKKANKELDL